MISNDHMHPKYADVWVNWYPDDMFGYDPWENTSYVPKVPFAVMGNVAITNTDDISGLDPDVIAQWDLFIDGKIVSEDISIADPADWPDYVFEADYDLPSLNEKEQFVKENRHLMEVPSARKMRKEGSYDIHEMINGQLKNVEELYLHTIDQHKHLTSRDSLLKERTNRIKYLNAQLETLQNEND